MPDVKPVSQQYVTSGDKGYFIDLYFPQLNIGIECDELYYLGNVANDRRRERDLIDILNAIDVSSYRAVHIKVPGDAADQLSEFDKQINDAVSELRAEVGAPAGSGLVRAVDRRGVSCGLLRAARSDLHEGSRRLPDDQRRLQHPL